MKAILVDGGELIAEDAQDMELAADWVLVVNGGLFQVGTEDAPFEHDFRLTLEGDDPTNDVDVMALRNSNAANVVRATDAAPNAGAQDAKPADDDATGQDGATQHDSAQDDPSAPAPQLDTSFQVALFELAGSQSRVDADMRNGEVYRLTRSEIENLNIRADLGEDVESVRFSIKRLDLEHVDSHGTFALFDTAQGKLQSDEIPVGRHTILIEGFDADGAGGDLVARRSVTFEIQEAPVSDDIAVALFDASGGDLKIADLKNGRKVDLTPDQMDQLNIVADLTDIPGVQSVRFHVPRLGIDHVENHTPYAVFGDRNGDLTAGMIGAGRYTVHIEGYSQNGAGGELLARRAVTFEVVGTGGPNRLERREITQENNGMEPLLDDVKLVKSTGTQAEMDLIMDPFWTGEATYLNTTDHGSERQWRDSGGTAPAYTNWPPDQPSNLRDQDNAFVANQRGQWGDQNANQPMMVGASTDWLLTTGLVLSEFDGL